MNTSHPVPAIGAGPMNTPSAARPLSPAHRRRLAEQQWRIYTEAERPLSFEARLAAKAGGYVSLAEAARG